MPGRDPQTLIDDALAIWKAGVEAVDSRRLVREAIRVEGGRLCIADSGMPLDDIRRILVVGAGKAGAGMARGVLDSLGEIRHTKSLTGWINVPEDCVASDTGPITLHAARPAGVNEPTEAGVAGTREILRLIDAAEPDDLVLCLISGGGSALMPAPIDGVTLEEKQQLTRLLSSAGANIQQLNTVRKQLSQVKGGRLARRCKARLQTLVISDVIGDPLDVIASGPTVANRTTAADALQVLDQLGVIEQAPGRVLEVLQAQVQQQSKQAAAKTSDFAHVETAIVGNNALAVDAAGMEAERRGYSHAMSAGNRLEGAAESVGAHLAAMIVRMSRQRGPDCLITGGEPTVELAPSELRGRGGRNQQLVLAAARGLLAASLDANFVLLSGGTDGEDGPTDAAGGWIDRHRLQKMTSQQVDDALNRNDAYSLLERVDGLVKTGPTHTNVCDVRVIVVERIEPQTD